MEQIKLVPEPVIGVGLIAFALAFFRWESVALAAGVALLIFATAVAVVNGWLNVAWEKVAPLRMLVGQWLTRLWGESQDNHGQLLFVGWFLSGLQVLLSLDILKSMGIFAQSGAGKSVLVEMLLCELVTKYSPQDLQICISDPKGVDYRIWETLAHLRWQIQPAQTSDKLLLAGVAEIERRMKLFDSVPKNKKCPNIEKYHRLIDKMGLDLPRLPYMVILLDEIQDVTKPNSPAEAAAIDIVKKGRAFGVFLWGITQRNTVASLSREIQSQFQTRIVGWMESAGDYGTVARVPKEVYSDMIMKPGRFMICYGGVWQHMQGRMLKDSEVEAIAARYATGTLPPDFEEDEFAREAMAYEEPEITLAPDGRIRWTGSKDQKRALILSWLIELNEKPTAQDFTEMFTGSYNTGATWIDNYWEESRSL